MPNPGVQSQFIARSGSNQFQGEYHLDWYNNALQGSNIPDEYTVPTAFNSKGIERCSTDPTATGTAGTGESISLAQPGVITRSEANRMCAARVAMMIRSSST